MNRGVLFAIGAYVLWGLFPIFWKQLNHVPALETLIHRVAWSFLLVLVLLVLQKDKPWLQSIRQDKKIILIYTISALLLALNWLVFIWAVNNNRVVEASLGYFINPLVSVLMGVLFLGERLRKWQITAVLIAFIGVIYLTLRVGQLPWIALVLAFSFGTYGLMRKINPLPSLPALGLEMTILFPLAAGIIIFFEVQGSGNLIGTNPATTLFLIFTGVVTAVPLLLFGAGAKRIDLSTIGILQYIAPTLQFLIGLILYNEPFTSGQFIGFALIWFALLIYANDSYRHAGIRKTAVALPASTD